MQAPQTAVLLRIFTEEGKMNNRRPLYEDVVLKARDFGLAGATVLRGPMGYGQHAKLHTAKILDLSAKLPLVIEIVDAEDKVRAFLAELDAIKELGLVTLERVEVIRYGNRLEGPPGAQPTQPRSSVGIFRPRGDAGHRT
jgi:PII-like signaling protein